MSTSNCANCKVTGLAVFPTLYAAVPSSVAPALPDGITGERVKAVNIEQPPPLVKNANKLIPNHATYKYGLRVARKGYLYVLYESGYKGKWQWDVYVVHGDGCLRLQPSALAIERQQDKLACETAGHQVARTHFFVIQDPENCEQVWLAFSEHKWTAKTLAQMADQNDASGRTKRMQPFRPKAWLSGRQSAGHAAEATESTVSQVLDYRKGMGSLLAPEQNNKKISDCTNGRYSIDVLCSQASVHPVQQRDGQSLQLVKQMQTTGKRPDGKSHPPVLFALWDAIGVVRDLKGYRDDAGGWVAVYMEKERALQVSGMSMIDGAKLAMENAAELEFRSKRALKATAVESRWRGPEGVEALRKQGAAKPPPVNEHYREAADLIADWESKGVPGLYVQRLEGILRQSNLPGWTDAKTRPPLEASRAAQLQALKAEVQAYLSKHSQSSQDAVGKAREQAWPRYEKLIVRDEARLAELRKDPYIDGNKLPYPLETFRANFNAFQLDADALIDARTIHLVKWLESSLLLDTLLTFDKDDLRSGVEFSNTVSDAIFGIGSSASGAKKLDAWVNELKADAPANLFWRAFALNHAKLETNINQALQAATNNKSKFTESEFGNALSAVDFSKGIYDVYNRAAGIVIEEEGKARTVASVAVAAAGAAGAAYTASPTSQPLSLPKQLALADRLVLTAGDRLFKLFRLDKTSDWVGEKVMLHLMNVRALVEPNESQRFIKEEVAERVKIRAKAKVQAKLEALKSGHDKQMSSVQSLKGQIPDDEYEKLVKKVRNTYASKNQEAQNRKLGHHSLGQIERQLTDEVRHDKTSPLRMAWDRFQTDPVRRDEHSTLIRERRLVAIVTMLELVNLSKLIAYDIASQGKDDAKAYWSLAASGMTIAAGVADMTGLSIKYLLNDKAVSFSRLKLFSGGMAVGATWIGAFFDYMDFGAESSRGRSTLASLYLFKSAVGFGLGVVTFAASATFAPNIARRILLNRVSASTIEQFSKKASKLLLARLVGATVGTWITAGLMVTQALIIALDDDALEKWCKNSPFGLEAAGENAFKDAEKMHQSLEAAIYDVK